MQLKRKNAKAFTIQPMSLEDQTALSGLSIQDAINKGLITSLGLPGKGFIFSHMDQNVSRCYAVVNEKAIPVSATLLDALDDYDVADLRFSLNKSKEKYLDGKEDPNGQHVMVFRLGKPAGIRLNYDDARSAEIEYEEEVVANKK